MFTIRLERYTPKEGAPGTTESYSVREARSYHLKEEKDGRRVLQLNDAPEEDTKEFTLGAFPAAQYQMAFVMNSAGKTIDVIR